MQTELLKSRIDDTADICEKTGRPKFLGFLSEEEAAFTEKILERRSIKFSLWGGYDFAQRVMLGCFPDWAEEGTDFPIAAVTFLYRKADVLRHRDFLGSLMALGLKREAVGDILVEEGRAVTFVAKDVAEYILTQIEKIGRTGVTVEKGFIGPLPEGDTLSENTVTVSSTRADCVVSAISGVSRAQALSLIEAGLVSINSVVTQKATRFVTNGDVITVRGKGKFFIDSADGRTKKNRVVLKYKKYT